MDVLHVIGYNQNAAKTILRTISPYDTSGLILFSCSELENLSAWHYQWVHSCSWCGFPMSIIDLVFVFSYCNMSMQHVAIAWNADSAAVQTGMYP